MKVYKFSTQNESETKNFAKELASKLKPKDVIVLTV